MVFAVDFFEEDTADGCKRKFANEQLAIERAELATTVVKHNVGRRLTNLLVREPHRRRLELWESL